MRRIRKVYKLLTVSPLWKAMCQSAVKVSMGDSHSPTFMKVIFIQGPKVKDILYSTVDNIKKSEIVVP